MEECYADYLNDLPIVDDAVEVYLRGPAVDLAAVRTWIESHAGIAEARTDDDPERRGGAVYRMIIVRAEQE
ncbi:hypothetical protein [Streptomyces sp. RPT161]|uniref:hypothetical protein n=1 Tax=Streptomyces sp. RPT161 TaxID=3015993 RepID=UPI0022B920FC|nr:hypothetical protein [Streptomyces sp. RPT161]